jgi:hypothetical protein
VLEPKTGRHTVVCDDHTLAKGSLAGEGSLQIGAECLRKARQGEFATYGIDCAQLIDFTYHFVKASGVRLEVLLHHGSEGSDEAFSRQGIPQGHQPRNQGLHHVQEALGVLTFVPGGARTRIVLTVCVFRNSLVTLRNESPQGV